MGKKSTGRMPRYAARRDGNEAEIVRILEGIGAQVLPVSQTGLMDLIVNYRGQSYFMEIKQRRGKLTEAQMKLHGSWDGAPIHIVRTTDQALAVLDAEVTA